MNQVILFVAGLLAAEGAELPEGTAAAVGQVRVVGSGLNVSVRIIDAEGTATVVKGEPAAELRRLQSVKVEVLGIRDGDSLAAKSYRILDVGGGAKPTVGKLVRVGPKGLAIRDGKADPIPLSLSARNQRRLARKLGSKLWVHGELLVSGEIRVRRYGILVPPPR